jgi:hypothetical protein
VPTKLQGGNGNLGSDLFSPFLLADAALRREVLFSKKYGETISKICLSRLIYKSLFLNKQFTGSILC